MAWPDHVDVVGLHGGPIVYLRDGHRCAATEKLGHEALMVRRQVLNDDVRHAAVGGGGAEENLQGIDSTR
jgi:hypothetical protein